MMLITTSRKPGQLTRAVARALCQVLGGRFENRGKSGFDSVLHKAEKWGLSRVLFVWEKNGNPARLVFFDLKKAKKLEEKYGQGGVEDEVVFAQGVLGHGVEVEGKKINGADAVQPDLDGTDQNLDNESNREKDAYRKIPEFEDEDSPWLSPEIRVSGVVFPRVGFRQQGCTVKAEDVEGRKLAKLFQATDGPNQMIISQKSLKAYNEKKLVLELKIQIADGQV